ARLYCSADKHYLQTYSRGGVCMKTSTLSGIRTAFLSAVLIALVAGLGAYPSSALLQSQRNVPAPTGIIQGVVQSEKGPEAGVWVIAETKDLLTNFIKIVVTRSEEHTSELQSPYDLVCRLLLEK